MGTDITLDPPVDGTAQITQAWLNANVRDPLYQILSPPTCMLQKNNTQTYLASNAWNAIEYNVVVADTENPATPMFMTDETTWDFEAGTSSWTVSNGTLASDTTQFHGGAKSVLWDLAGAGSFKATSPLNVRAAVPGNYGRASLWVYTPAIESVNVHHEWRTSGGTLLSETVSPNINTVANTWTQLEVFSNVIAPATTAFASISLGAPSATSSDFYYIDDAILDTYTQPTRIRVSTPGWYEATATVPMNIDVAQNTFSIAFRKNGTDIYAGDTVGWNTASVRQSTCFSTLISMAANDYLETLVRMSRIVTLTSLVAFGCPRWSLRRIRGI
jgi:hypothetical protein